MVRRRSYVINNYNLNNFYLKIFQYNNIRLLFNLRINKKIYSFNKRRYILNRKRRTWFLLYFNILSYWVRTTFIYKFFTKHNFFNYTTFFKFLNLPFYLFNKAYSNKLNNFKSICNLNRLVTFFFSKKILNFYCMNYHFQHFNYFYQIKINYNFNKFQVDNELYKPIDLIFNINFQKNYSTLPLLFFFFYTEIYKINTLILLNSLNVK